MPANRQDTKGEAITPLPIPGVTYSPQLLIYLALAGGALTEAGTYGILSPGLAQTIVSIAGIVVPLIILGYDAIVRLAHAKAIAKPITVSSHLHEAPAEAGPQLQSVIGGSRPLSGPALAGGGPVPVRPLTEHERAPFDGEQAKSPLAAIADDGSEETRDVTAAADAFAPADAGSSAGRVPPERPLQGAPDAGRLQGTD